MRAHVRGVEGNTKKKVEGKTKKETRVKRLHKSGRPIRDTPLRESSRSPYDPGRSEMAGCLSGRSFCSRSLACLQAFVRRKSVGEKDVPEVFIGSFRGTKRRRCPPPCQANIRRWRSSPPLELLEGDLGCHAPRRRGVKPPCGRGELLQVDAAAPCLCFA